MAFYTTVARLIIVGGSFGYPKWGIAPKTNNVGTILSKTTESLISFMAICRAVNLLTAGSSF